MYLAVEPNRIIVIAIKEDKPDRMDTVMSQFKNTLEDQTQLTETLLRRETQQQTTPGRPALACCRCGVKITDIMTTATFQRHHAKQTSLQLQLVEETSFFQ